MKPKGARLFYANRVMAGIFLCVPILGTAQTSTRSNNPGAETTSRLTARQVGIRAFPSVVLLVMNDSNGQPVSLGSGFFVRNGLIATNLHVIEAASSGYAKAVGKESKYRITGTAGVDEAHDLALVAVSGSGSPSLILGGNSQLEVGDEVYVIGNPQGLEGTLSQGLISGIRRIGSDTLLQITAPISPGSSGGPVLNAQGQVVGVATATFKEGQNLNFAIPASYVAALLERIRPVTPLPSEKRPQSAKSMLEIFGGRNIEGITAGQFKWDNDGQSYTFSLRNQLPEAVSGVICLVVFYDRNRKPIDYDTVQSVESIPPGLGRRVHGHRLDFSIFEIVESWVPGDLDKGPGMHYAAEDPNSGRVEFRVLDFKIVK